MQGEWEEEEEELLALPMPWSVLKGQHHLQRKQGRLLGMLRQRHPAETGQGLISKGCVRKLQFHCCGLRQPLAAL